MKTDPMSLRLAPSLQRWLFSFCAAASAGSLSLVLEEMRWHLTRGELIDPVGRVYLPIDAGEKFFLLRLSSIIGPLIVVSLIGAAGFTAFLWRKCPRIRMRVGAWLALFVCGWLNWNSTAGLNVDPRLFAVVVDAVVLLISIMAALSGAIWPIRLKEGVDRGATRC